VRGDRRPVAVRLLGRRTPVGRGPGRGRSVVALLQAIHLWRFASAGYGWWRRSLQARVVTATFLLGLIVVLAVGNFLYQRIESSIVQDRVESASAEGARLAQEAQRRFNAAGPKNIQGAEDLLRDVGGFLQGPADTTDRTVILLRSRNSDVLGAPVNWTATGVQESDIPPTLRHRVDQFPVQQYQQVVRLDRPTPSHPQATRPAVLVGSLVEVPSAGWYELYIVFDLDSEEQLLATVGRSFVVGGFALVLLVAAVAAVVTRQVVAPVRQAARTAEKLASGRLDQRMQVRGEDDLARLGGAFNEMATSLERQIHRLEELSRVQRRFVSDVSHELRTPLTTIRMATEMIYEARESFDPSLMRSAELLSDQLDRFEALLVDLLEISRFDAGAAALDLDTEDVCEVVGRVVTGLRPLAERRGSEVRVLPVTSSCTADIDARRVERVVRNLLANAIEHGEGRPIDVGVGADDHAVAVVVRDRGVGLRPSELRMVFNRFWRADPARTMGGTGLGLAIAVEDAHLHGGRLEVWGAPGAGASFRLTVPRRPGNELRSSPLPLIPPDVADDPDRSPPVGSSPLPAIAPDLPAPTGAAGAGQQGAGSVGSVAVGRSVASADGGEA